MNPKNERWALTARILTLLLVFVIPAQAQQVRTVQIRDGVVRVDDKVVPPAELPQSLVVDDVDLSLSFSGIENPVVKIGQHYYTVADGRLDEIDAGLYEDMSWGEETGGADDSRWYRVGFADAMTRSQMRDLEGKAAKMREMSDELESRRSKETSPLAEEMRQTAEMAAQMAAELPKMQAASYWDQVRATDRDLYNQLVREWQLESQIQQRAQRLRQLSVTGGETDRLMTELRSLLEEAFELKQTNRRREINELERQLKSLDEEMKKREEARAAIIDRRLQELVGHH